MSDHNKLDDSISFNNIRINSITSNSGVFSGHNIQYIWSSEKRAKVGFGFVKGEENILDNPCNVVTDPGTSSELLKYFMTSVEKKLGE